MANFEKFWVVNFIHYSFPAVHEVRRPLVLARPCLRALALFRGPRTLSPGPSLKGGQARFTDRFPVSYLVLFQ